jgi:hypothetical protein
LTGTGGGGEVAMRSLRMMRRWAMAGRHEALTRAKANIRLFTVHQLTSRDIIYVFFLISARGIWDWQVNHRDIYEFKFKTPAATVIM